MPETQPFYRKHIFICTNTVDDPRCCGQRGSEHLFFVMRRMARAAGLTDIAITRTGCMGRCMSGPSLVIYPDNIWYAPRNEADIGAIIHDHLVKQQLVERLLMPDIEPPLIGYDQPNPDQLLKA